MSSSVSFDTSFELLISLKHKWNGAEQYLGCDPEQYTFTWQTSNAPTPLSTYIQQMTPTSALQHNPR